jgi:hypothetical protein
VAVAVLELNLELLEQVDLVEEVLEELQYQVEV